MKWRELVPFLRELWHRPAGPMNWKNPIRVFAVLGWQVFQAVILLGWIGGRGLRFLAGLPAPVLLISAGLGYAVWHFVRRPFPALGEDPLLDLVDYHTPLFYECMRLWYYAAPFVTVMLAGLFVMTIWKVWFEGREARFRHLWAASNLAAFSGPKGSGNRHRGSPSPGRSAGDFQPLLAHHPGARTLYRRGDLRSRGIGENQRLHEPVCPAASRLASGQSPDAGGGFGARSQGRFLS